MRMLSQKTADRLVEVRARVEPFFLHSIGIASIAALPIVFFELRDFDNAPWTKLGIRVAFVITAILIWLFLFEGRRFAGVPDPAQFGVLGDRRRRQLAAALGSAFSQDQLFDLIRFRLSKDPPDLRPDALITTAEKEGWLRYLIVAAQMSRPSDDRLSVIRWDAGLDIEIDDTDALHEIVDERQQFHNIEEFIVNLAELAAAVCRISYPGPKGRNVYGTGFLVGPDLILTNYHVIEAIPQTVRSASVACQFDFRLTSTGETFAGPIYRLAKVDPIVDSRPYSSSDLAKTQSEPTDDELDFALLRLAEPVKSRVDPSIQRKWIDLNAKNPALAIEDIVLILQHPSGEPTKLTLGTVTAFNAVGNRIRYDANTLGGSSGSPCFNANLELVALHHAGDPDYKIEKVAQYNQAIPIGPIFELIKDFLK